MVDFLPWLVAGSQLGLRTSRSREPPHPSPPVAQKDSEKPAEILPDNQLGLEQTLEQTPSPPKPKRRIRSKSNQELEKPKKTKQGKDGKATAAKTKPKPDIKKPHRSQEVAEPEETEETATASTGPIQRAPKSKPKAKAAANKPPVQPAGKNDNVKKTLAEKQPKENISNNQGKQASSEAKKPEKTKNRENPKKRPASDVEGSDAKRNADPDVVVGLQRASTQEVEDKIAKRKAYKARKQRFYNSLASDGLSFFSSHDHW